MARRAKNKSADVDPTVAALVKELRAKGDRVTNIRNPAKAAAYQNQQVVRKPGRRGRKSQGGFIARGVGQAGYAAITGDFGIQVGCSLAEFALSIAVTAAHVAVESTETTADDKAFPYVTGFLATGARYAADKWLAKKHPGLAKVSSAAASSANGVVWSQKAIEWGIRVQQRVAAKSSK